MSRRVRVCAVQMPLRWCQDQADYRRHLRAHVGGMTARRPDLLVFPEDIGAPLVGLGMAEQLSRAEGVKAVAGLLLTRWGEQARALQDQHHVSLPRALFLARADEMRTVYCRAFSDLARELDCFVAAGSIPLPDSSTPGAVFNTGHLFDPQGKVVLQQKKVNLIPLETTEGLDLTPGALEEVASITTPLGNLAVAVCADCWDLALFQRLKSQCVHLVIDPAANPKRWTPQEQETNRQGLLSRAQESRLFGVQCFAVGDFIGLPFQGQSQVVAPADLTPDGSGMLALARSATEPDLVYAHCDLAQLG